MVNFLFLQLLEKLTYLDLSHSHYLTHTPDFSAVVPNLKKLILKDCTSLHELHCSSGDLDKLALLTLEGCKNLEKLPKSFYKLKSLETLILSGCSMIDHLDEDLGELVSLRTLLTDNTRITEPPRAIMQLRNLDQLFICGFKASSSSDVFKLFWCWTMPTKSAHSINLLLASFQGFNSLKHLSLSQLGNLGDDNIPKDLQRLPFLTSSKPGGNSSSRLPSLSLCELDSATLDDSRVHELDSPTLADSRVHEVVPDIPANLSLLPAESCSAQQFPDRISPLPMSKARSMKKKKKHHYIKIKKRQKITSLSMRLKISTKAGSRDGCIESLTGQQGTLLKICFLLFQCFCCRGI